MKLGKRLLLWLALWAFIAPLWAAVNEVSLESLAPSRAHRQATMIITRVIDRYHYRSSSLDDQFSEVILDRYLKVLDPNRSFFTRRDVETFEVYRSQLDDALKTAWLDPAFKIFQTYRQRVNESTAHAIALLDKNHDFTVDEEYRFDRTEAARVANWSELADLWRKRVKNDILSLKLAGKEDEDIRETLLKRYQGIERRMSQLNADDVFQMFINAYTLSLEPHTAYMSPRVSENFDINMRLSLEGIGAVLATRNEYTVVQRTVPGGPAALSGKVKSGDRIVGIAQGDDGDVVDVVGWRLQDVVELIRGPKNTVVRLMLLPKSEAADGRSSEITIVRNKIKLEESAASSYIIDELEGMAERRIGVITVPSFYRDFRSFSDGDKDFRSTTRDVRRILGELMEGGVEGVVIDLRQNGGGALTEATELTGLFIDTGPVVQVKDSNGSLDIEKDTDPGVVYTGPLAVLVDRNSASASEIFAGAIQDYNRGIIIGEPTFGKGTVQTLLDLNRFIAAGSEQLGRLRLTMAQFFRVNGGSTQFRGVVPDIVYPTAAAASEHGERSLDNALPWAKIDAADYKASNELTLDQVRKRHSGRVEADVGFKLLAEEEKIFKEFRERHSTSLLETRRKEEQNERDEMLLAVRNDFRASKGLPPLEPDELVEDADVEDSETDKDDKDSTSRIMVNEAAHILIDYIQQLAPQRTFAHVEQAPEQHALP